MRIQIFKAKSDIISFSKTLGQETSSQLQAQKCSKSDNCQNTIFKTTSAKKKFKAMKANDRQKDIFKEVPESFQSH